MFWLTKCSFTTTTVPQETTSSFSTFILFPHPSLTASCPRILIPLSRMTISLQRMEFTHCPFESNLERPDRIWTPSELQGFVSKADFCAQCWGRVLRFIIALKLAGQECIYTSAVIIVSDLRKRSECSNLCLVAPSHVKAKPGYKTVWFSRMQLRNHTLWCTEVAQEKAQQSPNGSVRVCL